MILLPVEETDTEGRVIYFKSYADMSNNEEFSSYDVDDQEAANRLFVKKATLSPKFSGYIYVYAHLLEICEPGNSKKHKLVKKIKFEDVKGIYPCQNDKNILFLIKECKRKKNKIRSFRLPSIEKAQRMRFVIDHLVSNIPKLETKRKVSRRTQKYKTTSHKSFEDTAPSENRTIDLGTDAKSYRHIEKSGLPRMRPYHSDCELGPNQQRFRDFSRQPISGHAFIPQNYELLRPSKESDTYFASELRLGNESRRYHSDDFYRKVYHNDEYRKQRNYAGFQQYKTQGANNYNYYAR